MRKHKNKAQEKIMADYMTSHPHLANNYIKGNRTAVNALWEQLAKELNSEGPPQKDLYCWKKAWADWKTQIRKKVSQNIGESYPRNFLTTSEDTVARICGFYNAVSLADASDNENTEDSLFKSEEAEIENVVWSDEMNESKTESENTVTEDIIPPEGVEKESCQYTVHYLDKANPGEKRDDDEAAESVSSEEEIPAQKNKKHKTPNLKTVQEHMASEVNAMQTIAGSMKEFLKNSKEGTQALEEGNSGLRRVYKSLEKLTELMAEQNALFDEQNKDQRNHFMIMQKNAAEKIRIKEKFLEIERLRFERESKQHKDDVTKKVQNKKAT